MLNTYTLQEAQQALQSKQISSRELTQACLDRIKDVDGAVKAFIGVDEAFALQQAEFADQRLSAGEGSESSAGDSDRPQRRDCGGRPKPELRVEDSREFRGALRRDGYDQAQAGGRCPLGPCQYG